METNNKKQEEQQRLTDATWQAFLDRVAPGLTRYEQIRSLGGMAKARQLMKSQAS